MQTLIHHTNFSAEWRFAFFISPEIIKHLDKKTRVNIKRGVGVWLIDVKTKNTSN